jgi:lipoprotein-anchoring transpeptidase ErfK/SrfK
VARTPIPRRRAAIALALAASLLLGACGSDGDGGDGGGEAAASSSTSTTTTTEATTTTTLVPEHQSLVAIAKSDSIDVYPRPHAKKPKRRLTAAEAVTVPGVTPIAFLGREVRGRWLKVYLPVRPNGSSGWVRRRDVEETNHPYRIEVKLSDRRIRVFRRDNVILNERIGVGRQDRPTPGGVYYIKELLQPPDPNGVYGSFAYGLSGFSTVLESFNGGQGVIGIHGTNDPSSIGKSVSSGCIRVRNAVIERMVKRIGLPLGTPVEIKR